MSSETPIYEARREPPVEKPPSLINQRVKLLVNQVESMPSDSNDQYRVYMVQDVTQALTKEKLEEIERVKRNLFRSISHDLVTYLNGAHGYLQEVRSCMQDHPYSPQLSKMIESSHKCMKL
jgi:K+-sensing histidine kinase KdpD